MNVDIPTDLIRCCISRWIPLHCVHTNVFSVSTTYWLPRELQSKHILFSGRFWISLSSFWYFSSIFLEVAILMLHTRET